MKIVNVYDLEEKDLESIEVIDGLTRGEMQQLTAIVNGKDHSRFAAFRLGFRLAGCRALNASDRAERMDFMDRSLKIARKYPNEFTVVVSDSLVKEFKGTVYALMPRMLGFTVKGAEEIISFRYDQVETFELKGRVNV